jgi:preprotein translocase subunit YajC
MRVKVALLILFVLFWAYLLIPAIKAAREHQEMKNRYTRDPETGYIIPK